MVIILPTHNKPLPNLMNPTDLHQQLDDRDATIVELTQHLQDRTLGFLQALQASGLEIARLKRENHTLQSQSQAQAQSHREDLAALTLERDTLAHWKQEQLTLHSWWQPLQNFIQHHAQTQSECCIGTDIVAIANQWITERFEYKAALEAQNGTISTSLAHAIALDELHRMKCILKDTYAILGGTKPAGMHLVEQAEQVMRDLSSAKEQLAVFKSQPIGQAIDTIIDGREKELTILSSKLSFLHTQSSSGSGSLLLEIATLLNIPTDALAQGLSGSIIAAIKQLITAHDGMAQSFATIYQQLGLTEAAIHQARKQLDHALKNR